MVPRFGRLLAQIQTLNFANRSKREILDQFWVSQNKNDYILSGKSISAVKTDQERDARPPSRQTRKIPIFFNISMDICSEIGSISWIHTEAHGFELRNSKLMMREHKQYHTRISNFQFQ